MIKYLAIALLGGAIVAILRSVIQAGYFYDASLEVLLIVVFLFVMACFADETRISL